MKTEVITADAVIAGGGLHGLSTAIHLANAGLRVVLLEQDRIGRHASSANAGGVRRLGRALPEIPLAQAALEQWHCIEDLVDDDCGFRESAQIKVAEDETGLIALEARSQSVRDCGFFHEQVIDAATLRDMLPQAASHCVGGLIVRGDGHADPFATVTAFHRKAVSLGVQVYERAPVREITHSNDLWQVKSALHRFESPYFVNAAGAWGGEIARLMGEAIPIEAQALMLMITERIKPFLSGVVGAQGRALSFKQFDNGTVLMGGAYQGKANMRTGQTTLDARQLAANARAAVAIFPLMSRARVTRAWAGIEGVTPDHLPIIGAARQTGGYHLFGFSAHGFALSPIGGRIIADLISARQTNWPIAPFSASRFSKSSSV
ncbi:MAG: FAD-binding oxidoreductase [Rhodobacteraceae bacterium]|nr:FAD-binding oxidoreductase [Paracoccaceae bacterium]